MEFRGCGGRIDAPTQNRMNERAPCFPYAGFFCRVSASHSDNSRRRCRPGASFHEKRAGPLGPARSVRAVPSVLSFFGRNRLSCPFSSAGGLLLVGVGVGLQQLVLHVGRNLLVGREFHRVGRRPRRERRKGRRITVQLGQRNRGVQAVEALVDSMPAIIARRFWRSDITAPM